jgi:hypothetical protein
MKWRDREKQRKRLVNTIEQCNTRLQDLLDPKGEVPSMLQALPPPTIEKSPLWEFWRHAADLYGLFLEAWSCRCRVKHHLKLLLKHRSSAKVDFNFLLFFERTQRPTPRPWIHQQVLFEMIEVESQDTSKTKLRFKESGPRRPPRPNIPPIINFCMALTKRQQAQACIGCLQVENKCYCVYPIPSEETVSAPRSEISLAQALGTGSPEEFGIVDRYFLALTLASSVLQLYSTPWLNKEWSKKDIVFFHNGQHSAPFSWDEPYLSVDLHTEPKDAAKRPVTNPDQCGLSVEERLAIILLELCFGRPLEESAVYRGLLGQFKSANATLDLTAATMWQKKARRHGGDQFADAINWCLESTSSTTPMSKTNRIKAFYKNVVVPLQRCHDSLTGRYFKDGADEKGDNSTNLYSNVSKGGVSFHGSVTFVGSQNIGTQYSST